MIDLFQVIELFKGYKPWIVFGIALLVWILPLHFAVKFVHGKTNILKSLAYSILSAFLHLFSFLVFSLIKLGEVGIGVGAVLIIWFYSRKFNVGLIRAILIILLQYVFGIVIGFIVDIFNIISVKEALMQIGVNLS